MQDLFRLTIDKYSDFAPIINPRLLQKACLLNLSVTNNTLISLNYKDTSILDTYIFDFIKSKESLCGVGGYSENRVIYQSITNFEGEEDRSIHLGIDIWTEHQERIFSPLEGTVHSFADNNGDGNYGPTIILQHHLENITFYTLYGHLSKSSLNSLKVGQVIKQGAKFAELGLFHENGRWPVHLHFQIIKNINGYSGDYPGVAAPSQKEIFLENCPDPNILLRIPCLG